MIRIRNVFKALWTLTTTIIYILTIIIYTLVLGIPAVIIGLFSNTGKAPYFMAKIWAWLIMITNRVKLRVEGLENIVKHRSYVFISNHASALDLFAIVRALPYTMRFVAKKPLSKIPVLGWAARLTKVIFIDRGDRYKAIETINKAISDLKDGISAYFFAEGTRSPDGKLLPFKIGGIIFALKAKLPIVPVTVVGSHNLLPKKSLRIRHGVLKIVVGKPIDTTQYTEKDKDNLLRKVRDTIRKALNRYTNSHR